MDAYRGPPTGHPRYAVQGGTPNTCCGSDARCRHSTPVQRCIVNAVTVTEAGSDRDRRVRRDLSAPAWRRRAPPAPAWTPLTDARLAGSLTGRGAGVEAVRNRCSPREHNHHTWATATRGEPEFSPITGAATTTCRFPRSQSIALGNCADSKQVGSVKHSAAARVPAPDRTPPAPRGR
jgi:hypothetical protein